MKLNGLTASLQDEYKSSNQYLQRLTESLQREIAALKEAAVRSDAHIEEQKTKVTTTSINDQILFLENAINMIGSVLINGKRVLTEETFTGPFVYKGVVAELPIDPVVGGVYIKDNIVYIYNGATYDTFEIPNGCVTKTEYDQDKIQIQQHISQVSDFTYETRQQLETVKTEQDNQKALLDTKLDKNPINDKIYVRKNDEWKEINQANNTVPEVNGNSEIKSQENEINIKTPNLNIIADVQVNGAAVPTVNKFGLSKSTTHDNYYELKYKRNPFSTASSLIGSYTIYVNDSRNSIRQALNQKWTVTTRDFQYRKTNDKSDQTRTTYVTSLDKNGTVKELYFPSRVFSNDYKANHLMDWLVWNPEYCPEGFENKAYFFLLHDPSINQAMLLEYDNGEYKESYDLTDTLVEQGCNLKIGTPDTWDACGEGGKALRNKNIKRICWVSRDTNKGGTFAIIFGGDQNTPLDTFDPTKCIYIKLPEEAIPGYGAMAATDKAWYLSENKTGRIIRITPNGRVTEYTLSNQNFTSTIGAYIEYTDKNKRPACAFRLFQDTVNVNQAIAFFEEKEDGGVNFDEVNMAPYVFTGWESSLWRMTENDYYIFYTAGLGFAYPSNENSFPEAVNVKKLIYWDKQTHTTHIIDDLYGIPASNWYYSYIGLYKTKDKAIWAVPHIYILKKNERTGEFKYIKNKDYTKIENGKDVGTIEINSVNIGTNFPWFACYSGDDGGWNSYPVMFHNTESWSYTSIFMQWASVNDDGIGCLVSPNYKAFALFYGDGNCQVYPIDDNDTKDQKFKYGQQITPDVMENVITILSSCEGLKHGWLIRSHCAWSGLSDGKDETQTGFTYIGIKYKNGQPTILERPHVTILKKQKTELAKAKHIYEYYNYLLTYDDYEKRKKIMRGIFFEQNYGYPTIGLDGYYKEVAHNTQEKLDLTYNNQVISSI